MRAAQNPGHTAEIMEDYGWAGTDLHKGIISAKQEYKQHTEDNFDENNSRAMCQGVKNITDYKRSNSHPTSSDPSDPDQIKKNS